MSTTQSGGSRTLLIVLLLGGGAFLLLGCVGCIGGGVYIFGFRGKDAGGGPGTGPGGLFAKTPQVSEEKYKAIDYPMTIAEVDALLGAAGQKATRTEFIELLKKHKIDSRDVKPPIVGTTFLIYRKDKLQLAVGFIASKKYGELALFKCMLETTGDTTTVKANEVSGGSFEWARERIDIINKMLAEPRWLKGNATKTKIVGVWRKTTKEGAFNFKADGKLVQFVFGKWYDQREGSYKFVDDDHVEMAYAISDAQPPAMDRSVRRVLLDGDEMILLKKQSSGRYDLLFENYQREK